MKILQGTYNNGKIKLSQKPKYKGQFKIIIQFIEMPQQKTTSVKKKQDVFDEFKQFVKKISKKGKQIDLTKFVIQDREKH